MPRFHVFAAVRIVETISGTVEADTEHQAQEDFRQRAEAALDDLYNRMEAGERYPLAVGGLTLTGQPDVDLVGRSLNTVAADAADAEPDPAA